MPAPIFSLATSGTDPKATTAQILEDEVNRVVGITFDQANPEDAIAAAISAESAAQSKSNAAASAGSARGDAVAAQAAAEASGDVLFYNTKADASAALAGLPANQVVEVFRDESAFNSRTRYRKESSALDLKLYLDINQVPTIADLKSIAGQYSDQVARVINNRQFGHFKWSAGDMSAQVSADPYGGLWVAPTSDATGASGAWRRMVESDVFDAEWWLPDAMPSDAQVMLNSGILALPNVGRLLLPRRETTTTGSIRLMKGLTYQGFGRDAPVNGGGGNFINFIVAANNACLENISAGNVYGQVIITEAAGFAIHDGEPLWQSNRIVENVSFRDCHTFDAEVGLSSTVSALNKTTGASPSFEHDVELFAPRDVYVENFTCDGVERIGIETMRTNGMEIVGGKVQMKIPVPVSGFDRGVRIAGAHNVHISGLHIVAPDTTSVWGISVEAASQGGGGDYPYTWGASSNVSVEGCTMEDCAIGGAVTAGFCRNINFSNNLVIGRRETYAASAFLVDGNATANGFALDETPQLNVNISKNTAVNVSSFIRLAGYQYGTKINGNTLITNASVGGSYSQTLVYSTTSNNRYQELEIVGNRAYTNSAVVIPTIQMINLEGDVSITVDDNQMTPNLAGASLNFTGTAKIRREGPNSNRTLPTGLWELIRPPLDQEDYPVGDGNFIDGIY